MVLMTEMYCDLNSVYHRNAKGYFCLSIFILLGNSTTRYIHIIWNIAVGLLNAGGACRGTEYQILISIPDCDKYTRLCCVAIPDCDV